jgi:hypothetical protein
MTALKSLAIRLALCALAIGLVSLWAGLWAFTLAGPFAIVIAKPLLDVAGELRHAYRRAHWRHEEGRHFVYRGQPVRVVVDADHRRWIRLADVRAITGFSASEGALKLTYPNGCRRFGRPAEPHLSDEALLAHLEKDRSPVATKLRLWVEREIAFPARRQRERHGIRPEPVDFRASD